MAIAQAVRERKGTRKFKSDEVPQEVVREILEEVCRALSWRHVQAWKFYVLMGDTLERFKKANFREILGDKAALPEVFLPQSWLRPLHKKYAEVLKHLLDALSIAEENTEARNQLYGDIFSLYCAPCLILASIRKNPSLAGALLDLGRIVQTICLLAHEKGLGTNALAAALKYPKLRRKLLSVNGNNSVVAGIALGYPDVDSPVNHFERRTAALNESVYWLS